MEVFIYFTLVVAAILVNNMSSGSYLAMEVSSNPILSGLTRTLTMSCYIRDDSFSAAPESVRDIDTPLKSDTTGPTNAATPTSIKTATTDPVPNRQPQLHVMSSPAAVFHLMSIVITKTNSQGEGETIAQVTSYDPPAAEGTYVGKVQVNGSVFQTQVNGELGFLSLFWTAPLDDQVGAYTCEANALDHSGHPLTLTGSLEIQARQPEVADLVPFIIGSNLRMDVNSNPILPGLTKTLTMACYIRDDSFRPAPGLIETVDKTTETFTTSLLSYTSTLTTNKTQPHPDRSITNTHWPITTSHWPITTNDLPTTDKDLRITNTDLFAITTNDLPITNTDSPITTNDLPITTNDLPITNTDLPITNTDSPITTNDLLITINDLPTIDKDLPITNTDLFAITTNDLPIANTDSPKTTNDLPKTTNDLPTKSTGSVQTDTIPTSATTGSVQTDTTITSATTGSVQTDTTMTSATTVSVQTDTTITSATTASVQTDTIPTSATTGSVQTDTIPTSATTGSVQTDTTITSATTGSVQTDTTITSATTGSVQTDTIPTSATTGSVQTDTTMTSIQTSTVRDTTAAPILTPETPRNSTRLSTTQLTTTTSTTQQPQLQVTSSSADVSHLMSIVITKTNSHGEGETVAHVTPYEPAAAEGTYVDIVQVNGSVFQTQVNGEFGYLSLIWTAPLWDQVGTYACEANALTHSGHLVTLTGSLEIQARQPSVADLVPLIIDYENRISQLEQENQELKHKLDLLEGTNTGLFVLALE